MAMAALRREGRRCYSPIAALRSSLIAEDLLLNHKNVILGEKPTAQSVRDSKNDIELQKNTLNYTQVVEMAFSGKVGNILRQTATKKISSEVSPLKLSNYEAVRCISSMPHSKLFIGGIPSWTDEQALNAKELLGCRFRMNDAIYRPRFGDIGGSSSGSYGVRRYSGGGGVTAGGVASYGSNTALANVAGGYLLNLSLFWHINEGIREILADYVHHEMTRNVILVYLRLFLLIVAKDVFLSLIF